MDIFVRDAAAPDVTTSLISVSLTLNILATTLVIVRIVHRLRTRSFGWDDAFIAAAVVFAMAHTIVDVISAELWGYGKHEKELTPAQASAPGSNLGFWLAQIMYKVTILLTKFSICLLYRRIFERAGRIFNVSLYSLMGLIILYYTAAIFATIFACSPVAKSYIKNLPGHCINNTAFFMTNAAFNITTDIAIMLLPLPVIKALHLPLRQKLVLCLVFAVGFVATTTSIYRIFTLPSAAQEVDFTYDISASMVWTAAEVNTSIICACLPVLKGPLQALFPRLFASNRFQNYGNSRNYGLRSTDSRSKGFPRRPDAMGMDTFERRIGHPTSVFKTHNSDDKSDDEMYILEGTNLEDVSKTGIMKSMDIKVTYEGMEKSHNGSSRSLR